MTAESAHGDDASNWDSWLAGWVDGTRTGPDTRTPPPTRPDRSAKLLSRRAVLGGLFAAPVAGAIGVRLLASGGEAVGATALPLTPAAPASLAGGVAPVGPVSIRDENARAGTTDWQIPQDGAVWEKVRGFVNRTSIAVGESLDLYVGTSGTAVAATVFRMGHYGGLGGRQVWTSGIVPAKAQPPARVDPKTNMRDAPWTKTLSFATDDGWVPGAYLVKLVSDDGGQSQIPFVLRADRPSDVHIQHDVTTWQAYNRWGGASLYEGTNGRSSVVSFDRPYDNSGSGHFLGGVYEIGALVESLGLDVTYSTSLDTHTRPDAVAGHHLWISPAHDEYWSLEMRNGVEAARDAGVNLMFLGANCMFRRIRLDPSPLGHARQVVNHRIATQDPLNGTDPARVTTSWREGPAARPESSIIGTYYESNPVKADLVIADASAWMFAGTGIRDGDRWPDVVGNEYDRVTPEAPTPPTIQVLGHSPVLIKGHRSFSDMTYYTTDSGAGVFSSGTIWFERHLLPGGTTYDAQIVAMMTNLLVEMARGPVGRTHPSIPNLGRFGIRAGYVPRVDPAPESSTSGSRSSRR